MIASSSFSQKQMKILIYSKGFPSYGGHATEVYKISKILINKGFEVKLLYSTGYEEIKSIDPDQTGKSHSMDMIFFYQIRMIRSFIQNNLKFTPDILINLYKYYLNFNLRFQLISLRFFKGFYPDLIISNIYTDFSTIQEIFPKKKCLFIIGGSSEIGDLVEKDNLDFSTFINSETVNCNSKRLFNPKSSKSTYFLINSVLTKRVYEKFGYDTERIEVRYLNFVMENQNTSRPYKKRKYSITFIASDFKRKIKNSDLARAVFLRFPEIPKLAVGRNSCLFSDIPNTDIYNLASQSEIMDFLSDSKVVIIPSFFDSSPSVLAEAVMSGCQVLVSENVGWHDALQKCSVVQNYQDLNEWYTKLARLIDFPVDNSEFKLLVENAENNLVQHVESLL
jgi:glycosyltransferase involved in cell wall biosynthesis